MQEERDKRWLAVINSQYPEFVDADIAILKDAEKDAALWLEAEAGTNILLLGPVGSGKTFTAFGLLRWKYVEEESKVELKNLPRLLDDLRRTQNAYPSPLDELCKVDYLLLDDFGAKRLSEWAQDELYLIMAERHMRRLGTVITANFTLDDLREQLDPRLFSRLLHRCMVVYLTGKDRRLA